MVNLYRYTCIYIISFVILLVLGRSKSINSSDVEYCMCTALDDQLMYNKCSLVFGHQLATILLLQLFFVITVIQDY